MINKLGATTPTVKDPAYFAKAFNAIQECVNNDLILAGHDISAGGLITTLLEMAFPVNDMGMELDLNGIGEKDLIKLLFSENPGVVVQVKNADAVSVLLNKNGIDYHLLGKTIKQLKVNIKHADNTYALGINAYRKAWYKTSYLFDKLQTEEGLAKLRFNNYFKQDLRFSFTKKFDGSFKQYGIDPDRKDRSGVKAAIIREKGVNGDREMA